MDLASYLQSRGVQLRRCGVWLKGYCPFHGENTPSFFVYDDHAHCYGCNTHVFDIVDAIWKLEFPGDKTKGRALQRARELHIAVPPLPPFTRRELPPPTEEQLIAIREAFRLWHEYLVQPATGKPAWQYLQRRGLKGAMMDQIWPQLGYAPTGSRACSTLEDRLRSALGERWSEVATSLGILSRNGNFLYRGRLIFTTQRANRIVFLQGRIIDENSPAPKYLNLFNIRKVAFIPIPYSQAIYEGTSICEGPLDAYALAASGIYGIGLAGSDLVSLKAADVHGPVFDYLDNEPEDKAGAKASKKLAEWCHTHHMAYQKADYPSDVKDPIRWVNRYGVEHLVSAHQLLAA